MRPFLPLILALALLATLAAPADAKKALPRAQNILHLRS